MAGIANVKMKATVLLGAAYGKAGELHRLYLASIGPKKVLHSVLDLFLRSGPEQCRKKWRNCSTPHLPHGYCDLFFFFSNKFEM